MSHQTEIDYLNSVKAINTATIANNIASIDAYGSAISSLNSQISSYQQLQTDLTAANSTLETDNQIIDDIIALLI